MIKSMVRKAFDSLGYDIQKKSSTYEDWAEMQSLLTLTENPIIFDIGAHHGATVASFLQRFPRAQIHAFEPYPESLEILRRSTVDYENVHIHPVALSNSVGSAEFRINRFDQTNSLLATDEKASETWGSEILSTKRSITVATDTLDRIADGLNLSAIDIMKVDVQGGEYEVFEGACSLLSQSRIGIVLTEVITADTYKGQHRLEDYLKLFRGYGYEMINFYNPVRRNGYLLQADFMFVSETIKAGGDRM